jgi:hypothetical protein
MRTIKTILLFFTLVLATASAFAQTPPASQPQAPEQQKAPAAPAANLLRPLILNQSQVSRFASMQQELRIAREQLGRLEAQMDGLIKDFKIELRFDPDKYDPDLQMMDQQKNILGFIPKAQESVPAPAAEKPAPQPQPRAPRK